MFVAGLVTRDQNLRTASHPTVSMGPGPTPAGASLRITF
jgi:hypothetical protein